MSATKPPIINCHVHTFTGDHVPAHLGKSVLPWPLYRLLNFHWVFAFFHWYYSKGPYNAAQSGAANEKNTRRYLRQMRIKRNFLVYLLVNGIAWYGTLQAVHILLHWTLGAARSPDWILSIHRFLVRVFVLFEGPLWLQVLIVLVVMLFFRSGRNLILFVAKNTIAVMKKLPGKETKELFDRYMTIGRYTFHRDQQTTLDQLQRQYPAGTGFVVLPMDMEHMDAGKVKETYLQQMDTLVAQKKSGEPIYPFVFVDPRRIEADKDFFDYTVVNGRVELLPCRVKTYIEDHAFSGFKIYPALGYYPFDPLLLPLWKYAAQRNIPIVTHCVRGPMYFRGAKSKDWDFHPVFQQKCSVKGKYDPLLLEETKNDAFSANFTHPMNFLCLLKKQWLAKVVADAIKKEPVKHQYLKDIFQLSESEDENKKMVPIVGVGLDDLKICLAHYGGNDEWLRYWESDRYGHNNELAQHPVSGIDFLFLKGTNKRSYGKPEQLWKSGDWYSIISSMILQHPNVYADISYILHHDEQILPLLKQTLQNPGLRSKVLYGTDFFVVRNHKSDKQMLADMMGGLSEDDFDQVARCNPRTFLNLPALEGCTLAVPDTP